MVNIRSHPEVYRPFLIIVFVSIVQQFSGVSVIRAYSVAIFDTVFSNTSGNANRTVFSDNNDVGQNVTFVDHDLGSGPLCQNASSMAYISAIVIGVCRYICISETFFSYLQLYSCVL